MPPPMGGRGARRPVWWKNNKNKTFPPKKAQTGEDLGAKKKFSGSNGRSKNWPRLPATDVKKASEMKNQLQFFKTKIEKGPREETLVGKACF